MDRMVITHIILNDNENMNLWKVLKGKYSDTFTAVYGERFCWETQEGQNTWYFKIPNKTLKPLNVRSLDSQILMSEASNAIQK